MGYSGRMGVYLSVGRRSWQRGCELASEENKVEGGEQRAVWTPGDTTQSRAIL